ncbi:MAG: amidophosphoribosyltransferase [Methanothermococcus sp.]|jgi:amidophosphoribosyltransferase|uniref:amidophosphoribosyltransferase n=1 Tax=Methanothermococcus TaxID=155862 RepID=UPI00035D8387|nr:MULTISPECIES: amidophosphoribosyltransferase [Methanothermococcus]MDK2790151.1 amidophosphoribosyltransferase [Methanothermococcus sp.]MDK2987045.1 amidophosphoribosyltransferase [Methanothermococcus sp.]
MCGIFGIYSYEKNNVSKKIYYGLYALQHRGQEGAGIATSDGRGLCYHKGIGLVPDVFTNKELQNLYGHVGIGHVRYSTTGDSIIENCQPFVVNSSLGRIAIAHNGDIVNSSILKRELENKGHIFVSSTDSEVIAQLLVRELLKTEDIVEAIANISKELIGAYSLLIIYNKTLIAVRDPHGFKPLCMGKDEEKIYFSSESCALDVVDAKFVRDIKPGEIVIVDKNGINSYQLPNSSSKVSSCMFEYVYFARPDSVIDGISVYKVRRNIGKILAKEHPCDADIISPVPDSGITFALGYSEELNIPYYEGLIKNRYVGRTFILPTQEERDLAVRLKMNPVKSVLDGKKVVLIDDSIVRGTTSRRIVNMVRKAGAKEVHLRIGSPKIMSPCFYGIDMPTREELIANSKDTEEIARHINADSVGYLSIEGLIKAIGRKNLCLACLSGEYPTDVSCKLKN